VKGLNYSKRGREPGVRRSRPSVHNCMSAGYWRGPPLRSAVLSRSQDGRLGFGELSAASAACRIRKERGGESRGKVIGVLFGTPDQAPATVAGERHRPTAGLASGGGRAASCTRHKRELVDASSASRLASTTSISGRRIRPPGRFTTCQCPLPRWALLEADRVGAIITRRPQRELAPQVHPGLSPCTLSSGQLLIRLVRTITTSPGRSSAAGARSRIVSLRAGDP